MPEESNRQSIVDEEHLKLLSLGYMISAGITAFFGLFGLLYVIIGLVIGIGLAHAHVAHENAPPPAFLGWIFMGIGVMMFLLASGVALAKFWTARCIKLRKSRTFCMIIAGLSCLEVPYGTALGVLTFMVLGRDSVSRQFSVQTPPGELPGRI